MPRRSRGCAECRQRRIGCDGGQPSCRQCLITARTCSGPARGAIIINQTDRIILTNRPRADDVPERSLRVYQPSTQAIFAHAFINEFVSFITARNEQARRQSWLTEIQRGSIVEEGSALELSMQATALAYCGAASSNPAAVRHACSVYGKALSNHSQSIAHDLSALRAASLCTCVMLSLFEAICSTNSMAYGTHLRAAQKMLELAPRDADGIRMQVILQLGQHVRCQTLFVMIASPKEFVDFVPEPVTWSKWTSNTTDVVERLIDALTYLSDFLARRNCSVNTSALPDPDIGPAVNNMWQQFQEHLTQAGEPIQLPTSSEIHHSDPFIVMVVAYFAASQILLSVLQPHKSTEQFSSLDSTCQDILNCSHFLEGKNLGCAHLRMFFPLMLVGIYGPRREQRGTASKVLRRWLENTAFKGMGSVAFQRVQSPNSAGFWQIQVDRNRANPGIRSIEAQ